MSTPTIPAGNLYMNATTYTGTGSALTITNGAAGQSFQPDFVWVKSRSGVTNHYLKDVVRGVSNQLYSNSTAAEASSSNTISAFNSNGFSVGTDAELNTNGGTYVGWQWKANGTAVTNTAGSITSSVSANTTSGFSVVTWTATASAATIGHGLGVAPAMYIIKCRNGAGENWLVYHQSIGTQYILLNTTAASVTNSGIWNAAPNSSVFSYGSSAITNGNTYVAYCWAAISGFSAFGSYTGNGSTDGPFIYTGFRPRFVMIKKSSGADNWNIEDSARNTYNPEQTRLLPNDTTSEQTSSAYYVDFLSNGFKFRTTDTGWNGSGDTFIYAAFAENPFKYANAR